MGPSQSKDSSLTTEKPLEKKEDKNWVKRTSKTASRSEVVSSDSSAELSSDVSSSDDESAHIVTLADRLSLIDVEDIDLYE